MNEPVLHVLVRRGETGRILVASPAVGMWSAHPHPGALVGPGSRVGRLDRLNHRCSLALPEGSAGRVRGALPSDRVVSVEYGQALFELDPLRAEDGEHLVREAQASGVSPSEGLPTGHRSVSAPTDGVFYRAPRPGARPFVSIGDTIREGQPVGLVEVMKTFGQVLYGGPGLPDSAVVVEIRADDGAEIRAGQVLLIVR